MNGGNFPATRWSVLEAARGNDAGQRALALETLCAAYWKPVYKYIRLKFAKSPEESQDLTQGFFAELLERQLLGQFDARKSRLRTFLRLCVDSFVLNEIKHGARQKRGGDVVHLALDFSGAESELHGQTIDPGLIASQERFEEFFEKEWIRSLLSEAVEDLKTLCAKRDKATAFALFEGYELAEDDEVSYAELAGRFGITAADVTNQLAWARREFRRLAQERLRSLCGSEEEFVREAKALFGGQG
ncbi:MAG TPA: sigma-70 family RNA polymerase sigma factor [Dongiaceae bacterium]|nr:sigma-70 family RNA polymerase sigma factor [Dongiaceae bacterium]